MQKVRDVSGLRIAESIQKKMFALLREYLCRSEELPEQPAQIGIKSFINGISDDHSLTRLYGSVS
jgi:hypothetical protein